MTNTGLGRLPSFLRHLSTYPSPADALHALATGPFERLGMRGGMLWRLANPDELVAIGAYGHTALESGRYARVPLELDLPLVECVRTSTVTVVERPNLDRLYLTALDRRLWDGIGDRAQAVVCSPIRFAGDVVGALGVTLDRPWPTDERTTALLCAVTDALGLWATHPRTGSTPMNAPRPPRGWSLAFTDRQRDALRRVAAGQSTAQIAADLAVSESSVKQDLQAAMSALRTSDRRRAAERARELRLL